MPTKPNRPLGHKAYGSIPHLPGSRQDRTDKGASKGQYNMCCVRAKFPKTDEVIVQEKIDGSCCAIANVDGKIIALNRPGYRALSSPYEQHHLFSEWVGDNSDQFEWLGEGHRIVGEWIAQAHGTRYAFVTSPFVPFDIMHGHERTPFDRFRRLIGACTNLVPPPVIHRGAPISVEEVAKTLEQIGHRSSGASDPIEGAVWRVQRTSLEYDETEVLFLAKWVRPDKVDGKYLPEISGLDPVWNWRPE